MTDISRGIMVTGLNGVRTNHLAGPYSGMFGNSYLGSADKLSEPGEQGGFTLPANLQPVSDPNEWNYPGDAKASLTSGGYTPPPMVTADGKVFAAGSSGGGFMNFFSMLLGGAKAGATSATSTFSLAQQQIAAQEAALESQKRTTTFIAIGLGVAAVGGLVYFLRK